MSALHIFELTGIFCDFFVNPPGFPEGGDVLRATEDPLRQAQGGGLAWGKPSFFLDFSSAVPFHLFTLFYLVVSGFTFFFKPKNLNHFVFQAEARAEFAERSVQKLQKEVDRLEGERNFPPPPSKKNFFLQKIGTTGKCAVFSAGSKK